MCTTFGERSMARAKGETKPSVDVSDTDLPPDFTDKVVEQLQLNSEKKAIEARLADVNEYLKLMMEINELEKVTVGRATVNVSTSFRTSILPEKLLEKGVAPEVIAYATKSTSVVSMTIKAGKEESGGGE